MSIRAPSLSRRLLRRPARFAADHPDLVLLIGLLALAGVVRAMFLFRAPVFLRHDSVTYFQAGYDLARGQGFDLPLRRTPLYPLFIAGVVATLGEDLRGLAFVQHLLGLATVAATYLLGKALFGRVAGALAGLITALSAPLLIYEHYILSEPLFTPLLVLGLLLIVYALRGGRAWLYVVGGAILATAALSRPIAQALLPVVPFAILVQHGPRPSLRPTLFVLLGFALVLLPWTVRSALATGRVGSAGALGQTLIDRVTRHDQSLVLPDPDSTSRHEDPTTVAVRRLILAQGARDARPSAINHRIRTQFGLSEAEANAAMLDVGLEVIRSQPERYVRGSLTKFRRILVGEDEGLRLHSASRKDGELRETWLAEPSIAHLWNPPSATEERESPTAEALTQIFQPYRWLGPLAFLISVGLVLGLVRGPRGPTVLLLLAVVALVLPGAALVGQVSRYRYPADPLLAVFAGGGLVALGLLARAAAGRLTRARRHGLAAAGASRPA